MTRAWDPRNSCLYRISVFEFLKSTPGASVATRAPNQPGICAATSGSTPPTEGTLIMPSSSDPALLAPAAPKEEFGGAAAKGSRDSEAGGGAGGAAANGEAAAGLGWAGALMRSKRLISLVGAAITAACDFEPEVSSSSSSLAQSISEAPPPPLPGTSGTAMPAPSPTSSPPRRSPRRSGAGSATAAALAAAGACLTALGWPSEPTSSSSRRRCMRLMNFSM
mmetsp:Transcript_14078/g.28886  ORF Transcript_14078/g.28886 Transcript_14078/m.28886 type:complete len:222 (+) Transcript_14078:91-756(+)